MGIKISINLKNGLDIEGELARSFSGNDMDVELIALPEKNKLLFSIDEIACITLAGVPGWVSTRQPTSFEEVQTITGLDFKVAIYEGKDSPNGFFGVVKGAFAPEKTIYFVNSGVRCRHQELTIGQILQNSGSITSEKMNEALKQQEALRNKRMGELIAESANVPQDLIEKALENASKQQDLIKNARVGDILIEAGLVTREQVERAFEKQKTGKKMRVGELLISQGLVTENHLLEALATKFQMRFIDLKKTVPSDEALRALSEGLATKLKVFPLELNGNTLVVATSSPTDPTVGDNLRFSTNLNIDLVVSSSKQIEDAIDLYYHKKSSIDSIISEMASEGAITIEEETETNLIVEPDSKIISLINNILIDAYKKAASDIHIEPGLEKSPVQIRYRIDGECQIVTQIAPSFKSAIISRIKILANLDISERRRPQSGKIMMRYEGRKLEFRVEITPTVGGHEDAVLRMLAASKPLPLDEMGLHVRNLENLKIILAKPYGLILCVGPTGSGKTTTLHSALGYINKPNRKIWTAEDPVEITQAGLRQVQVNPKIGYTFADALRSFLRADPDVVMIGEMRDKETAHIGIEASLTGHQVFSTLHTNSAPETVVRLIDMGLDPFNFADALLGILAQRLARRLCKCKVPKKPTREQYDELVVEFNRDSEGVTDLRLPSFEDAVVMSPKGCELCSNTGYKGRVALHELLTGTLEVKKAIKQSTSVDELRKLAIKEGMLTLRMDGIIKVFSGITDIDQINKVCI